MSLEAFLRRVVGILEAADVPYMLTGSLASAYHATPRATRDIDVVIDTGRDGVQRVVAGLREAGYYVDRDAAMIALETRGQFNAIDPDGGWKVDFIVRKDRPFSRTEFERREAAVLLGVHVSVASLEDVLLAKLEWSTLGDSDLQRRDVAELLERAGARLEAGYVDRWARELGLSEEWADARRRSGGGLPPDAAP